MYLLILNDQLTACIPKILRVNNETHMANFCKSERYVNYIQHRLHKSKWMPQTVV